MPFAEPANISDEDIQLAAILAPARDRMKTNKIKAKKWFTDYQDKHIDMTNDK